MNVASSVAGATVNIFIGLVVFVTGFYVFLSYAAALNSWFERNLPLTRQQFRRLSTAFHETGRGLIVGLGATAMLQGAITGVGYQVVGVRHAFALALLTAAAALIPPIGSGFVWLPVAASLALTGDVGHGIVVVAFGCVAGLSDNVLRPALSRFGRLRVPTFVLFCAMLGGIMAFGASGVILGPLAIKLAMEGLRLWRHRDAPSIVVPNQRSLEQLGR